MRGSSRSISRVRQQASRPAGDIAEAVGGGDHAILSLLTIDRPAPPARPSALPPAITVRGAGSFRDEGGTLPWDVGPWNRGTGVCLVIFFLFFFLVLLYGLFFLFLVYNLFFLFSSSSSSSFSSSGRVVMA